MDRLAWPTAIRAVVGIMVAGLVAGTVLFVILAFDLTGAFPEETGNFIEDIQRGNEWHTARNPLDIAQGWLFATGFAGLAVLGHLMSRLLPSSDSRRAILSATMLLAGGLGVAAQLLFIGAKPVATSSQYCDCGLLTEELMSRLMAFNIVMGIQTALTNGAIIAAAVGLVIVARPGVHAGMPSGWGLLTYATAVAAIIVVALWSSFETYPVNVYGLVVLAAVLLPAWAIWLAQRAESLRLGDPEGDATEIDPEVDPEVDREVE